MKTLKRLILLLLLFLFGFFAAAEDSADEIIREVDGYRQLADTFTMKVRISDYKEGTLRDEAEFQGHFKGSEKSLLLCTMGKNRGMKVLMKGDNMWVSLTNSRRALRVTPMQRLMGQASNGDVAKVALSVDYAAEIVSKTQGMIKMKLQAKRKGATYQKILLYLAVKNYEPLKAEFFLLSGKHLKTAFYEDFMNVGKNRIVRKIRIEDMVKKGRYSVMEYEEYKRGKVPEKYFNVVYLPKMEL